MPELRKMDSGLNSPLMYPGLEAPGVAAPEGASNSGEHHFCPVEDNLSGLAAQGDSQTHIALACEGAQHFFEPQGKHVLAPGEDFQLSEGGRAQLSVQARVERLVGDAPNDSLGTLRLERQTDSEIWESVEQKEILRGRFGHRGDQRIGLVADLEPGRYRLRVDQASPELQLSSAEANFEKPGELKAATWNMLWTNEPMSRHSWGSAAHYSKAMAHHWDADVIFYQEVDKGDRGYDNHHVLNMLDDSLNERHSLNPPQERQWSLTWAYDDRNLVNRVNSYLVTQIERDHWMDPSGGALSFASMDSDWGKAMQDVARREGTLAAKGTFSREQIEAAGGQFLSEPGKHGQMSNQFLLGEVWNYKYYMNVSKARGENGEVVYLANLHLKSGGDYAEERREQIDQAMNYLKRLSAQDPDYDGRILLAGDFNTYQIKRDEGTQLVERMRERFGYAVDASMASAFDADPNDYMEQKSDWHDGRVPRSWDQVPSFLGRDGSIQGGERFDAFILLGEGWSQDMIGDFHFAGPREFEMHRHKDFVPDSPENYNHGRPVADTDHLPGRVQLFLNDDSF